MGSHIENMDLIMKVNSLKYSIPHFQILSKVQGASLLYVSLGLILLSNFNVQYKFTYRLEF